MVFYGWLQYSLWLTARFSTADRMVLFSMADCMVFYDRRHGFQGTTAWFSMTDCMVVYGRLHDFL
jgi:hypothetical protein